MAHYVGIDRSYLYRIFMEHENTSPKQYLLKHRLQMATQLLCSSTCTITEAALSCGLPGRTLLLQLLPPGNRLHPKGIPQSLQRNHLPLTSHLYSVISLPCQKITAHNHKQTKQFHNSKKRRKPSRRLLQMISVSYFPEKKCLINTYKTMIKANT